MVVFFVKYSVFVEAGSSSHVNLAADDGFDACFQTCLIEINGAVHVSVVCDGQSSLADGFGMGDHVFNFGQSVEE